MGKTPHIGKKINRIRELCGIKQETLAGQIGISQQSISKIEQSKNVDDTTLEKIASALGIHTGVIKNFDEDTILQYIKNSSGQRERLSYTFNPIDKIIDLYDQLLTSEREKVKMLEKLVEQLEALIEQNKNQVMEAQMIVW